VLGIERKHLNKIKRNNTIGTAAATLLTLAFFLVAGPDTIIGTNESADAVIGDQEADVIRGAEGARLRESQAPAVVSGDNVYIA
jgi:hypothetical protein